MKRLLTLGLSLGLVATLAVPALAGGATDKATGSFVYNDIKIVQFNAHEEKENRPAKGSLWISPNTTDYYTVDIESVEIDPVAGTACFGGIISASGFYADRDGKWQTFYAKDGGEPGAGVDVFRASSVGSMSCPEATSPLVASGNLQIHAGESYE